MRYKKYFSFYLILVVITFSDMKADLITGQIVGEDIVSTSNPKGILQRLLNWASDQENYISGVGGLTFTYPTGLFLNSPDVIITIQSLIGNPINMLSYCIVSNSPTSTTVSVFELVGGLLTEVPDNTIKVHIYAVGERDTI